MGRHVYNYHLAIFWKFNSVPDVSNLLKLPTPILLEVSLSTMGTVFVRFHFRLRQHIVYFHWSSPFQTYLSISPFTIVFHFLLFLNFRIPITRNLIILFFLPLLSSTLPKSELRAAITTISTSDHSKVTPSKNEEKSPTAALSVTYTSLAFKSAFFWRKIAISEQLLLSNRLLLTWKWEFGAHLLLSNQLFLR